MGFNKTGFKSYIKDKGIIHDYASKIITLINYVKEINPSLLNNNDEEIINEYITKKSYYDQKFEQKLKAEKKGPGLISNFTSAINHYKQFTSKDIFHEKLVEYLKNNRYGYNPQEMIDRFNQFYTKFPKNELNNLTLEKYTLGSPDKDNFSNWVDHKTKELAEMSIIGLSTKFIIYSNEESYSHQKYLIKRAELDELNEAQALIIFENVKRDILNLIRFAENDQFEEIDKLEYPHNPVKNKIAFLYFPNKLTSLMTSDPLMKVCELLGLEFDKNKIITINHAIFEKIKQKYSETASWNGRDMGHFLYTMFNLKDKDIEDNLFITQVYPIILNKKQIIFFGPPGTGKTRITKKMAMSIINESFIEGE